MIKRIQQLPSLIANQIAAGEVIERPASVVKELIENAIDAKASQIIIDIAYGGLNQIKMSDNGTGILADDLPLAIAPHATSKIRTLDDLYAITSMGFRGEALASIASVARLTISSRAMDQEHGMLLDNRDHTPVLTPCARQIGTTVDIQDIFYNAPVRKKFLRSERSEYLLIDSVIRRAALSLPNLSIQLNHNGISQLTLPAAQDEASQMTRISRIMGKQFIDNSLYLNVGHEDDMKLYGWISNRHYQRSQNDRIWFYINGRIVKDRLIQHAIKQAYEELLYPGRFPVCLLYLTINPAEVDVNVHPTKHEVRFQQPRLIHDFIYTNLKKLLNVDVVPVLNEQNNPTKIYENYIAKPIPSKKIAEQVQAYDSSWYKVAEDYYLNKCGQDIYLVAIKKLRQQQLLTLLQQAALPLASRPLLVPIFYDKEMITEDIKHQLADFGIKIDNKDGKYLIRTLPILAANLNIKKFMQTYLALPVKDNKDIIRILIDCQEMAWDFSEEVKADLQGYLEENLVNLPGIIKKLHEPDWAGLLNVD